MLNTTICAIATAPGGAIGIIRISGPDAISIVSKIFVSPNSDLTQADGYTLHYGHIIQPATDTCLQSTIDQVLVSVFRAPHSYTGEDSIEISCHGSAYIMRQILQVLISQGATMAQPGEYTQRAFANGKLDLSQAEAVADLIASTNSATHRMAISQLRGNFANRLATLRQKLLKLTSLLELELDFSDHEDLEFADRSQLLALTKETDSHITQLADSFAAGQAMKHGINVAIAGKTNVGKSTLLNLLTGDDRAIVSDIHGTTRDVIEETVDINGTTFRLIDTAGLRETDDTIEQIGIERTYRKLSDASIILWMLDTIPASEECDEIIRLASDRKLIIVNNKTDLVDHTSQLTALFPTATVIGISAKHDINTLHLRQIIYDAADLPVFTENDVIVTSSRHYDALLRAHEDLQRVTSALDMGLSGDLVSEDLRLCIHHLAEITGGEITPDETLGNIFQHFCIGK